MLVLSHHRVFLLKYTGLIGIANIKIKELHMKYEGFDSRYLRLAVNDQSDLMLSWSYISKYQVADISQTKLTD